MILIMRRPYYSLCCMKVVVALKNSIILLFFVVIGEYAIQMIFCSNFVFRFDALPPWAHVHITIRFYGV